MESEMLLGMEKRILGKQHDWSWLAMCMYVGKHVRMFTEAAVQKCS